MELPVRRPRRPTINVTEITSSCHLFKHKLKTIIARTNSTSSSSSDSPQFMQPKASKPDQQSIFANEPSLKLDKKESTDFTERDKWIVKTLPRNFNKDTQDQTHSAALERLDNRRRETHNKIVEDMYSKYEAVNVKKEEWFRLKSAELKQIIEEYNKEIVPLQNIFNVDGRELLDIPLYIFRMKKEDIKQNISKRHKLIDEFCENLKENEEDRVHKFKEILKDGIYHIKKVSYLMPQDVQMFMEMEITKINQSLLENLRVYADLQLVLKLEADKQLQLSIEKIEDAKNKWKNLRSEEHKRENKLSVLHILVHEWYVELKEIFSELDFTSQQIISLYELPIKESFRKYKEPLSISCLLVGERCSDPTMIPRVMNKSLEKYSEEDTVTVIDEQGERMYFNEEIKEKLKTFLIDDLREKLQLIYCFVADSGDLWISHHARIYESQKSIELSLRRFIKTNDQQLADKFTHLNTMIDKMRQEHDPHHLKQQFELIEEHLTEITDMIIHIYENELEIIEKYRELVAIEMETFIAEIDTFQRKYPNEDVIIPRLPYQFVYNQGIGNQLSFCEHTIRSFLKWKKCLFNGITLFKTIFPRMMESYSEKWIKKRIDRATERYHLKEKANSSRQEVIKKQIHNVRLKEINAHKEHMTNQIEIMNRYLEATIQDIEKRMSNFQNVIETYEQELSFIVSKGCEVNKKNTVTIYSEKLNQCREQTVLRLEDFISELKAQLLSRLNWAKEWNKTFLMSPKMFSEGGNFNTGELHFLFEHFMKCLIHIEDTNKALTKSIEAFDTQNSLKINELYEQPIHKLEIVCQETDFIEKVSSLNKQAYNGLILNISKLKSSIEKVEVDIDEFKVFLVEKILHLDLDSSAETLISKLNDVFSQMDKLYKFMQQFDKPLPIKPITIETKQLSIILTKPEKSHSAKGQKKDKGKDQKKVNQKSNFNYKTLLFGNATVPNVCDTFIWNVYDILSTSFLTIQTLAEEFYKLTENVEHVKSCIKPTFELFFNEILIKYKYYHIQCEYIWIRTAREYINLSMELKQCLKTFMEEYVETFHNSEVAHLKRIIVEAFSTIQHEENYSKVVWCKKHDLLKPLYGHPNNTEILEKLNEDMIEFLNESERKFGQFDKEFCKTVTEQSTEHEKNLKRLSEILLSMNDYFFYPCLNSSICKQINLRIIGEPINETAQKDTKFTHKKRLSVDLKTYSEMKLSEIDIPLEYKLTSYEDLSDEEKIHYIHIDFDETINVFEDKTTVEYFTKLFEEERSTLTNPYTSEIKKIQHLPALWSNIWEQDVKKVCDLYETKYF